MSKTTKIVSEAELRAVALPTKTETYTVISHGFIIDEVTRELKSLGFEITMQEYRASNNLEIARGSYIIKRTEDVAFAMAFNWVNSYDKSTKFQCGIGGYVWENNGFVIDKEDNGFIRKHTGEADTLVKEVIADKILNADKYYLSVLDAKKKMETIKVTRSEVAKILGELYFSYDMISIEQLSGVKKEYNKPSYLYTTDSDSLWTVYCHILTVIKGTHPKLWMQQQAFIHNYIKLNYLMVADVEVKVVTYDVDPSQTNILDQIADLEADQIDEDIKYAVSEDVEIHVESDQEYLERVAEIEGEPEVVQEGSDFDIDLHQSEEIILDIIKAEKNVLTEDELAHQLYGVDNDIEVSFHPAEQEIKDCIDEIVVQYTDPAGNTFEVPVVASEITDSKVLTVLQKEVNDIFGYEIGITVLENGENYNIVTADGQEVCVPITYVTSLLD
jgi:hypothetical protein